MLTVKRSPRELVLRKLLLAPNPVAVPREGLVAVGKPFGAEKEEKEEGALEVICTRSATDSHACRYTQTTPT